MKEVSIKRGSIMCCFKFRFDFRSTFFEKNRNYFDITILYTYFESFFNSCFLDVFQNLKVLREN